VAQGAFSFGYFSLHPKGHKHPEGHKGMQRKVTKRIIEK
jgi:hypothetical protein